MKLSKRLKKIDETVTGEYDHIWDCCCDHGFLGAALLKRQAAPNVHFVDIVPELIERVKSNLQRFYPNSPARWYTHCLDITTLPLNHYPGKHLIVIAGVGGDLMVRFIESIRHNFPTVEFDFLLCPVHHQFTLRQKLTELSYNMKCEVLVEDNQRFYEIMFVTTQPSYHSVHQVGSQIWQSQSEHQQRTVRRYLTTTLEHYRRIQAGKTQDVQYIIDAYDQVLLSSV